MVDSVRCTKTLIALIMTGVLVMSSIVGCAKVSPTVTSGSEVASEESMMMSEGGNDSDISDALSVDPSEVSDETGYSSGLFSGADQSSTTSSSSAGGLFSFPDNTPTVPPVQYKYEKYAWETKIESNALKYPVSNVTVDFSKSGVAVSEGIYAAGYDGWGDITDTTSVDALKNVKLKYLRIPVDIGLFAGNKPGAAVDITRLSQKDGYMTLADRVEKAQKEGFTPILAFSSNFSLPSYFKPADDLLTNWFYYNLDGTRVSSGVGDQVEECARIAGEIAFKLKSQGYTGLIWESLFEIGYGQAPFYNAPAVIHYEIASTIKKIDPSSKHMGPATFTGWSVEKFVEDYFEMYGAAGVEYLDYVSFHQYGGNFVWSRTDLWDFNKQYVSMVLSDVHTQYGLPIKNLTLLKILSSVPLAAAESVTALKSQISQLSEQYGVTKKIKIAISEYDVNNYSNYKMNPSNQNYPRYSAASDTSINTNYYGGVNTAYLLSVCSLAGTDIMIKFNTRAFYGLVDNDSSYFNEYYRTPVWYSFKLLQDKLGLTGNAVISEMDVEGPIDDVTEYKKPWVFVCTVKKDGKTNLLILNRGAFPAKVNLSAQNLSAQTNFTRYYYGEQTTADYIGNTRPSGTEYDGVFEGGVKDGWSEYVRNTIGESDNICLFPMGKITPDSNGKFSVSLDKFSYVILQMN